MFVEAVHWGASHALSSCVLHRLINAVYIKHSHLSPSASTLCIFILAYCLPWAVLTNFQRTARHRHFSRLPSGGMSVVDGQSPYLPKPMGRTVNHRCPSQQCPQLVQRQLKAEAIWPSSNFHPESHARMTTHLIRSLLVLNSFVARQRSFIFCSPQKQAYLGVYYHYPRNAQWMRNAHRTSELRILHIFDSQQVENKH